MRAVSDPGWLLARMLRLLPPELAHRLGLRALVLGLWRHRAGPDDPVLSGRLWGLDFPNPVGLAAGFDKDAEAFQAALGLGFGFVEVGSVAPRPQQGNPRPRLFRLPEAEAVINRLGFNSAGFAAVEPRLARRPPPEDAGRGIVGVNLGVNRDSPDPAADYALGVRRFAGHADYLVVNLSSPNTPGLRDLQAEAPLARLLEAVMRARAACDRRPPLLLKIAPDLGPGLRRGVAEAALAAKVDGLVVGNTTLARPPGLASRHAGESGGLSGRPLFAAATEALADMYRLTSGRLPLIGVGGIASGGDAYTKVRAGASLVQLYTALIYQGPGLVGRIKTELALRLRADGFASLADAVGADHRR